MLTCSRIRRVAHNLTDARITDGIVTLYAKAIRHLETFIPSLIGIQTGVLIHGQLLLILG